jgi:hypothetical protein
MIKFERVTLHNDLGDEEGMLVFWNNRLIAVVSRLGQMHESLTGRWFLEAPFCALPADLPHTFANLEEVEVRLSSVHE